MAGNQFGGSTQDRFGYYAAPAGTGGAGSTTATSTFGGSGGQVNAFGTPYQPTPPTPRTAKGPWIAVLVLAVVLAGALGGAWWWKQRSVLVVPQTLGGMQLNTTTQASKALDAALAQASERAGSQNHVVGGVYGTSTKEQTVLLISKGPNVSAAQPPPVGKNGVVAYGPDLCQSSGRLVTCVRAQGQLAVVVMAVRAGPPVPPAVVAGWADEAWLTQ